MLVASWVDVVEEVSGIRRGGCGILTVVDRLVPRSILAVTVVAMQQVNLGSCGHDCNTYARQWLDREVT